MDRREFLAAAPLHRVAAGSLKAFSNRRRQFIEAATLPLLPGTKQRAFSAFIGAAAIPAMNRAGVARVGAFNVVYGENAPSLLLVLAHQTLDSVISLRDRLAADAVYGRAGATILEAPMSDPAFVRVESTLLRAIDAMPTLEPSPGAGTARSRIFELRTYESHSNRAALNKLKMFNAGEVPIFRRAGLAPVFFGETLIGANMPSLIYMLTFADMPARCGLGSFHPRHEWKTLSADPQYRDNVSAISDIILRPTPYSQI